MSDTLTRKDLVEVLAKKHDLPKSRVDALVVDLLDDVTKALKKGNKVALSQFGIFEVKKRPARKGRNPATGAAIKIPAKKNVRFKSSAGLKKTIG
ncbi:MAG TPA: HU family DNA-binding protein [Nevskia sp.]|jgi:DNA-binding protein HU-beta|nr:HU family DNA-binding protein [Nevskia sp.]HWY24036.1 HU family DNA-binding protein [Nevskia sp.]HZR34455.1 HU family DNA-binding protein [Nevskia sp.]